MIVYDEKKKAFREINNLLEESVIVNEVIITIVSKISKSTYYEDLQCIEFKRTAADLHKKIFEKGK